MISATPYPDPGGIVGGVLAGSFIFLILGLVIYLGIIALSIWIGYLIMRTAVKNGILLADQARANPQQIPRSQQPPYPPSRL